jgi:hypothetical protein
VPAAAITGANGQFCDEGRIGPLGLCCGPADEARVQGAYAGTLPAGASDECKVYYTSGDRALSDRVQNDPTCMCEQMASVLTLTK